MLMIWNLVLLRLKSVAFWLINYVSVLLDCDLTYQSYFLCWFTVLLFYDAKRVINWECSDDA